MTTFIAGVFSNGKYQIQSAPVDREYAGAVVNMKRRRRLGRAVRVVLIPNVNRLLGIPPLDAYLFRAKAVGSLTFRGLVTFNAWILDVSTWIGCQPTIATFPSSFSANVRFAI